MPAHAATPGVRGRRQRRAAAAGAASVRPLMERTATLWVAAVAATTIVLCAGPPAAGARALKAMWGPTVEQGVSQFPIYRDLGVQLVELQLDWATTAVRRPAHATRPARPGLPWPAELDRAVAEARANGIRVAVELIAGAALGERVQAAAWAPRKADDLAHFAGAAARHYPTVHLWMVWGEPTRRANFATLVAAPRPKPLTAAQRAAPHLYAQMLDAAYGALKGPAARTS